MSAPQERDVMEFKGINFNAVRADGEMADMHNLSCDEYPVLTQRKGRTAITDALVSPTNVLVKTDKLAYVAAKVPLAIGATYGGGKVAYILQVGDAGYDANVQKGFIVTPTDLSAGIAWSNIVNESVATSTSLGAGQANTTAIISALGFSNGAAKLCNDLVLGGYSDWYLPSSGEMLAISANRVAIGGFPDTSTRYWTSSQYSATQARYVVVNGMVTEPWDSKNMDYPVRAIRNFSYDTRPSLTYDGVEKGNLPAAGEKQMCSVGNRIIIFPDKKYYDTNTAAFGSLDYSYTQSTNDLVFTATTITSATTDFTGFLAGDAIKISGCTTQVANNKYAVIKSISGKVLTFDENMFTACTEVGVVTLAREIPDMDFICEYNNRLWGCKGNLVYASKQGDPFNFNVYKGVSTDSYAFEVGTDGSFTGISGYTSHLVLFKENCIHKVYGTKPANFQLSTSQCSGLKIGSEKSIAVLNDTIIYQSKLGIMAYTGNIPELISKNFGARVYSEANAGTDGEKYYVSLKNGTVWDLLVFDTKHNLWMKEDHTKALDFAFLNGKLIFLSGDDGKIYQCNADSMGESFTWDADFGESTEYMKDKKAPMKFYIHAEMEAGSTLTVRINCDRQGWQDIYYAGFAARKTIKIPVAPKRCDVFALQVAGRGKCKIFSISRSFTARGDNNAS